ncbi:MAG: DNA-binding protein [Anaerolineae bacterium]|nr:DNA-binding protein [Anaerolineae bacterium]
MKLHAMRLKPMQDLKQSIYQYAQDNQVQAGFVLTCVGSLQRAALRMANQDETTILEGKFEICSLVGTVELGGIHLHIALSDGTGAMIGGHLQDGSLIYTTAEIVLGQAHDLRFSREYCADSGYDELVIRPVDAN